MPTLAARLSHVVLLLSLLVVSQKWGEGTTTLAKGELADPSRFDKAMAGLKESERAMYLFERIERVEEKKSSAESAKPEVKVALVFPAGTGIAHIPLGLDGAPANSAAYRGDMEKLLSELIWAATDGKQQREAYERVAKKQKERAELIDQTRSAFLFTFLGKEMRGDRMLSKFSMEPNPRYKPISRAASIFAKVKGTVWLDDASGQMARIEGDVAEDVTFGIFLGKIYKGSHFMQERYEFEPGEWLPSFSEYDFDARKLFSQISVHQRTFASHYRRVGPPAEAIPIVRAKLERLAATPSAGVNQ